MYAGEKNGEDRCAWWRQGRVVIGRNTGTGWKGDCAKEYGGLTLLAAGGGVGMMMPPGEWYKTE
ncbi:hypothetical protein A3B57_01880 [Microgenomates group bacterium RIFCSPLOWO2_01_FULL_47_10]|nr:MAG: hypothetical protein A3B57_01880 [Microgenomates group bacterium RIFCSPLOWO2_01_FULL_47_10]